MVLLGNVFVGFLASRFSGCFYYSFNLVLISSKPNDFATLAYLQNALRVSTMKRVVVNPSVMLGHSAFNTSWWIVRFSVRNCHL